MQDPAALIAIASSAVIGLGVASAAALKGWHGWLDLKRLEVSGRAFNAPDHGSPSTTAEVRELKERIRKLEAIASGIDG